MNRDDVNNKYFAWLYDLVCEGRFSRQISYKKLLMYLHNTEFRYLLSRDSNRADDGIYLRYRFAYRHPEIYDAERYLEGPCSVLEMMVALSLHCEENIMDDPAYGDRTGQWFWGMIVNMGLGSMSDDRFDKHRVSDIVERFLDRDYSQDGRGGLFTVTNCDRDLRTVEIWHQMCWYLDGIS